MARRPAYALAGALGCAGALTLTWLIASFGLGARWLDAATLNGFTDLRRPRITPIAYHVATLADPAPFILCGLALIAIAIARGRPRLALLVPTILLGANVTSQVLKPLLAHPRAVDWVGTHIAAASWPSGHATAAMSLALCAVLVAPPRLRPLVAAGGAAYAVAISYSLLTLGWHYPSDVLGGYLVAATWTLLGIAALWAADRRWPARSGRDAVQRARDSFAPQAAATVAPAAGVAVGAAGLAMMVALARPEATIFYARAHTTFFIGALVIGAVATALAAGLAVALRR